MQLYQEQLKAVLHKEGPMLVLAGPGSGKTLVITERTNTLIKKYKIPEENILVITFTKAAANEMKERFLKKTGSFHSGVNFGTFHSVFFAILKHAYHLGPDNIVREEVRHKFMQDILKHSELDYENDKELLADILSEISLVKGNHIDLKHYYSLHCPQEIFLHIYKEYDKRLRAANLIDFDDMLLLCYQLFTERKDILKLWQEKFKYILIDEFQDINKLQYEIIRMLSENKNNIFAVGDDDQSIYRFRGAKPEIMLAFPEDFPGCQKLYLNRNYRSTKSIINASNALIGYNRIRFPKQIEAIKGEGRAITIQSFEMLSGENKSIAEEIIRLHKAGVKYSEIAVLVRTNMGSGALLHKLMEFNIPFSMRDILPNIYDHWIALDFISYLKIAGGSRERKLFLQIINRPKRYILRECFDTPLVSLEALKNYYEDRVWMLDRLEQLEYDLSVLAGMNPYAALNYIRKGIGYEDYIREYAELRHIKPEELIDIMEELQESARDYKTIEDWFLHISEYKDELKKQAMEQKRKKADCIIVSTMHAAKGLEFEAVFIADANEGVIPHKKAVLEADLEEERRLFYVAMTRAKEHLYIYSTEERYNKKLLKSRFIDEILK